MKALLPLFFVTALSGVFTPKSPEGGFVQMRAKSPSGDLGVKLPADFSTVRVSGGEISGTLNPDKEVHIFRGIPFAAPPVGDLRWKAPQPVKPWTGIRKCDAFGPSPMQERRIRLVHGVPSI